MFNSIASYHTKLLASKLIFFKLLVVIFCCFKLFSCKENNKNNPEPAKEELDSLVKNLADSAQKEMYNANYNLALEFQDKRKRLFKQLKNEIGFNKSLLDEACIYDRLGNVKKAIEIGENVLKFFEIQNDIKNIGNTYSVLSAFYGNKGDLLTSEDYANKALKYYKIVPLSGELGATYNQLACVYLDKGSYTKAINYFDTSINIMKQTQMNNEIPIILLNKGYCFNKLKDFKKAKEVLFLADSLAEKEKQIHIKIGVLFSLSDLYELENNFKKSKMILNQAYLLKDSIKLSEMETSFLKKEKEKELNILNEKYQKELKIIKLQGFIIVLIIIVFLIWLYFYKSKLMDFRNRVIKQQNDLKTLLTTMSEKNSKINFLESQLIQKFEIENKNQVLMTSIEAKLNDNSDFISYHEINNNEDDIKQNFLHNTKILTKLDWETFKSKFNEIYPSFIAKIRQEYPHITPSEERHLLLIKISLNSSEIANILGIGADSVKKSRQRLRKRLNISQEIELESYIKKIKFNSKV